MPLPMPLPVPKPLPMPLPMPLPVRVRARSPRDSCPASTSFLLVFSRFFQSPTDSCPASRSLFLFAIRASFFPLPFPAMASGDLCPAYAPFFGVMGSASAIIFTCKTSRRSRPRFPREKRTRGRARKRGKRDVRKNTTPLEMRAAPARARAAISEGKMKRGSARVSAHTRAGNRARVFIYFFPPPERIPHVARRHACSAKKTARWDFVRLFACAAVWFF